MIYYDLSATEIGKKCEVKRATVYMVARNRETEEKKISGGLLPKASKSDKKQTSQFSKRTNLRLSHSKGSVTCSCFVAESCLRVSKMCLAWWRSWYCLGYRYILVRKRSLLSTVICRYNLTCPIFSSRKRFDSNLSKPPVSSSHIHKNNPCMLTVFLMRMASECLILRCTTKGFHPCPIGRTILEFLWQLSTWLVWTLSTIWTFRWRNSYKCYFWIILRNYCGYQVDYIAGYSFKVGILAWGVSTLRRRSTMCLETYL